MPTSPDAPDHEPLGGLTAQPPRIPVSVRRPQPSPSTEAPPPPPAAPAPDLQAKEPPLPTPAGPVLDQPVPDLSKRRTVTSSRASTDPKPDEPLVPPEKLADAITQAADVALVLAGQGLGAVVSKAKGIERDQKRWMPTGAERALILKPTASIIGRHVKGNVATADAVDAAMATAGLAHFAVRAGFDLELLPEEKDRK